jgi:hypothetical protein
VAVIDFDNSDTAWRDYDASKLQDTFLLNKQSTHAKCNMVLDWHLGNRWKKLLYSHMLYLQLVIGTARELFREFGCSDRVYQDAFNPMLLVGLFAPGELCSAAACLGMLYYFILAHQVLCPED